MASPRDTTLRIASFTSWLLLVLSLVFWALRLWPAPAGAPAPAAGYTPPTPPDPGAMARALGPAASDAPGTEAVAAVQAPPDKLVLHGVVAGLPARGVALIAVNDKPAQPYRIGGQIAERYVLRQVEPRSAVLGRTDGGGGDLTLELVAPNPEAPQAMRPAAAPPRALRPAVQVPPQRVLRPPVSPRQPSAS